MRQAIRTTLGRGYAVATCAEQTQSAAQHRAFLDVVTHAHEEATVTRPG